MQKLNLQGIERHNVPPRFGQRSMLGVAKVFDLGGTATTRKLSRTCDLVVAAPPYVRTQGP